MEEVCTGGRAGGKGPSAQRCPEQFCAPQTEGKAWTLPRSSACAFPGHHAAQEGGPGSPEGKGERWPHRLDDTRGENVLLHLKRSGLQAWPDTQGWGQDQEVESSPFKYPPGQSSPLLRDASRLLVGSSLLDTRGILDTGGLCSPWDAPPVPWALSCLWACSLTLKPRLSGAWTLKGSETQSGACTLTRTLELMAAKHTCRHRYMPRKSVWVHTWTRVTTLRTRARPLLASTPARISHPTAFSHGRMERMRLRVSSKAQQSHTCSSTQLPASWAVQASPFRTMYPPQTWTQTATEAAAVSTALPTSCTHTDSTRRSRRRQNRGAHSPTDSKRR